jgi:DNA polymerase-3 subunit delta
MAVKTGKSEDSLKPVYVICGKDKYLVNAEYESLLDKLLSAEDRAMALYQPETDKAQIADVLDELRTLPFLAKRRVVVIKDADKFISENREALEKYFDKPCQSGVFVLVVDTWQKNTKLAKKLPAVGGLIEVSEIKHGLLGMYAGTYARDKYGKKFDRNAAELLVELAGDDPGRLCSEVDKLAIYIDERNNISIDDVEKLIGHNRMFNAFAVIDAMTAGNAGVAVERLRNMFASDRNTAFTVVGAFAFHFRRLFNARALLDKGMGVHQIAGKLRIWGNKEAFFRQVKKLSLEKTGALLGELARIDFAAKTGQRDVKAAIEQMVLKMGIIR